MTDTKTKTITIDNPSDWQEGDMAERVWPDGTLTRGVLRSEDVPSALRIGQSGSCARFGRVTLPNDDSTVTVTREVPGRVLPTVLGSVILATKVRGVTLDPPVVAALYDGGGWITATLAAGMQYYGSEHIEEWVPATTLPTEAVGCSREIVTAALGHMESEDWTFITGDDLRTIRDALAGVQA